MFYEEENEDFYEGTEYEGFYDDLDDDYDKYYDDEDDY